MRQFHISSGSKKLGYLIFLLPLVEIAGFIIVGHWLGVLGTIGLVMLTSFFGMLLLNPAVRLIHSGNPTEQLIVSKISGILLFLPGFFTDTLGLLLLFPGFRVMLGKCLIKFQFKDFSNFQEGFSSKTQKPEDSEAIEGECWQDDNKKD